jgi:O-antigen/teichoic acid export membrane protein
VTSFKAIVKNLGASFSSHAVAVLQQVALTPVFLHSYGKAGLGQWLALSAAVSYLGTLDFGVQTFVNQDLTVRYQQGEMEGFHVRQSTALRLLLGIVFTASAIGLVALILPLEHWLRMDGSGRGPALSATVVRGTVYLLALQVLFTIIFGFFCGQFMVIGRYHIGQYWNNIKNLAQILFALPCLLLHTSFLMVALAMLVALVLSLAGVLITLFRMGRDIFPTLRYWDGPSVPKILKPSGYFALIYSSNFLVYQVPVFLLQRSVGPVSVAVFATTRTIFSMTRNVMNSFTQALGPEVTRLYARRDWPSLSRLYDYSERLIFALIPIANIGALLLCPLLSVLWLRDRQMFVLPVCMLCACISIVMSAKEHKYQFQFSTNTHRELARFTFGSYVALVLSWMVLIPRFGVVGLLWGWFAAELAQVLYIMHLNAKFFADHETLSVRYPIRMAALSIASIAAAMYALPFTAALRLPQQVVLAVAVGILILALDIPMFGLVPVWGSVRLRLQKRFARA